MSNQCKHVKPDSNQCQGFALPGDDFCWWHSKETEKARAAARRKGGRAKARLSQVKEIVKAAVEDRPELRECKNLTLDDIQINMEDQLEYIENQKKYSSLSQADRVLYLRISVEIRNTLCLKGLDFEGQLSELEDLARGMMFD